MGGPGGSSREGARLAIGVCLPKAANRARANSADTSAGMQPAPAASFSFGRAFSMTRSEPHH